MTSDREKQRGWYKERHYVHFDQPVGRAKAWRLVSDSARVARHAFWPFISTELVARRFRPQTTGLEPKRRRIAYASHVDSHIFSYYAMLLGEPYEAELARRGISECVLAYRRFPEPRCNIHFAKEAFDQVKRIGDCSVLALDVEDFFGSINHRLLREQWCQILGRTGLSADHYSVFRAITRYSHVDRGQLYQTLGISRRRAKRWWERLCSAEEFRDQIRAGRLVQRHTTDRGIPQGSPISAQLSNLYMLDLDTHMAQVTREAGAVYRRYSDDILLICPPEAAQRLRKVLEQELEAVGLSIAPDKTRVSHFRRDSQGQLSSDKPMQYLGFLFDGRRTLIRSTTIARYLGRMSSAVSSAQRAARRACRTGGDPRVFRRAIYRRFSGMGRGRSYLSYVRRAESVMTDNAFRRQHRRHWRWLSNRLAQPFCTRPCPQAVHGALSECQNRLGHGAVVPRAMYCPYADRHE